METISVKNRRLKISPGGVVTLPVSARKTLGMLPKQGTRVTVAIDGNTVAIRPVGGPGGFRISPKGQMEMRGEPRGLLESGEMRHFWLELHDLTCTVLLHPWK